jgi:7-cyano-7-deazaguanine reductase
MAFRLHGSIRAPDGHKRTTLELSNGNEIRPHPSARSFTVSITPGPLTHENRPECYNFSTMPASQLETFPNPEPGRDYEIRIRCPEFTSVCPKTGLPDFGEIVIIYTPDNRCIELKALKYYLIDFRNRGIFYEAVTNQILDDLVAACSPRRMTVIGDFSVRGGISTTVTATYEKGEGRKEKGKRPRPERGESLQPPLSAKREAAARGGGAPRALRKVGPASRKKSKTGS